MKAYCLGSSSMGNCILLQFSNETTGYTQSIMVEAGFSWKEIIKRAVDNSCASVLYATTACLITHGHSDHSKGIKQVLFNGIDVYASKQTHTDQGTTARGKILEPGKVAVIAPGISTYPFIVEHDYPDSLGFIISCKETGENVLFVNDCKYYKQDLSAFKFDYIFMECNYEDKYTYTIYNEAKKVGDKLRQAQYERVIQSHMALSRTKKNIQNLNLERTKAIFLMHLSDRNANEFKMKSEIKKLTNKQTFVCQRNGGIK